MFGYVLQNWTTIRAQTGGTTIIQDEDDWMGFSSFEDIVFWIDMREATVPASQTLTLALQSSPSKDEALFQTMVSAAWTSASSAGLVTPLPKVIQAQAPAVPLATWLRWQLSLSAGASPWDITFRVLLAANRTRE